MLENTLVMYDLHAYGSMIADKIRIDAYAEALHQAITPDSVVLDIGTGTGIFALLACKCNARKIYAIEPNPVIHVAREIAAVNGFTERIEFIEGASTQITQLPERADVIVSDLRGVLPLFKNHIPSLVDARKRMLAPGGKLIPKRDHLWVAVLTDSDLYEQHIAPWGVNTYGFRMEPAQRFLVNTLAKEQVKSEQLLLEPRHWGTLDYAIVESPNLSGEVSWIAERTGMAHGLIVWFDAILVEGIHFSNAPNAPNPHSYSNVFFPWPSPVAIAAGDTISVKLHANLVGKDYYWRWESRVRHQGDSKQFETTFKQSSFLGQPLPLKQLRKRVDEYVPTLSEEGQIDRFILELMQSGKTINEIARQVAVQFATRFVDWRDAIERVRNLSKMYSK